MLIVIKYTELAFLNNIAGCCLEWGSNCFSCLQFKMFQKLGGHIGDQQKSTVKLHLVKQLNCVFVTKLVRIVSVPKNDSTFLPAGQFIQLLSFFPASGKNSGEPYLSTPNVEITFCVSAETIKSAKAFAPEAFTLGHLAGFTSIT